MKNIFLKKIFSLSIIILFFPQIISSKEFTITNGSDLNKITHKLAPDDIIIVKNGIQINQYFHFFGMGRPSHPIILKAQTQGKVVLTGTSRLDISGQWLVVDGFYFERGALQEGQTIVGFKGRSGPATDSRLTNSTISNYSPVDKTIRYSWVGLYGQRNRVDHNRFQGDNNAGVTVAVFRKDGIRDEHVIEYNHFLDRERGLGNGYETIRVGPDKLHSDSGTLIQHNLFERTNGEAEVVSLKSSDNIVRFNTFKQVKGAVTLRQGKRNKIIGNYFLGEGVTGTGGIRITGEGHLIANNVMQDLGGFLGGSIALECGNDPALPAAYHQVENTVIAHNTLINNSEALIKYDFMCGKNQQDRLPKRLKLVNNLFINTVGPLFAGQEGEGWSWQGNMNCEFALKKCTEMYGMVLGRDQVWRPRKGSTLSDATAANNYVTDNIDGRTRTKTFDMGAKEASRSPQKFVVMTAQQVGPITGGMQRD